MPCLHDVEGDEKIIHVIYAPDGRKIELCDEHFNEVLAAGLVSEPYVSREYINERVGRRVE